MQRECKKERKREYRGNAKRKETIKREREERERERNTDGREGGIGEMKKREGEGGREIMKWRVGLNMHWECFSEKKRKKE